MHWNDYSTCLCSAQESPVKAGRPVHYLQAQRILTTSGPNKLYITSPGAFSGGKSKQHAGVLHMLENEVCGNVYGVLLHLGSEGWAAWCWEEGNRDYDTVGMVQLVAEHPPVHLNTSHQLSSDTLCSSVTLFFIKWEFIPTLWDVTNCHVLLQPPFTERSKLQMRSEKKPCFSLVRKIQLLFLKCSLFIFVALKHTHTDAFHDLKLWVTHFWKLQVLSSMPA